VKGKLELVWIVFLLVLAALWTAAVVGGLLVSTVFA